MLDMVLNAMVLNAPLGSSEIKGGYIILHTRVFLVEQVTCQKMQQIHNAPKFLNYYFAIDIHCNILPNFGKS